MSVGIISEPKYLTFQDHLQMYYKLCLSFRQVANYALFHFSWFHVHLWNVASTFSSMK